MLSTIEKNNFEKNAFEVLLSDYYMLTAH